jgi:hypothetical protein
MRQDSVLTLKSPLLTITGAIYALKQAIDADPHFYSAYCSLGDSLESERNPVGAVGADLDGMMIEPFDDYCYKRIINICCLPEPSLPKIKSFS